MRKLFSFITVLILGTVMMMAQDKVVTGSVISEEDGEPVIGASVVIPGTTTGTVTDIDGNFSLRVPSSTKVLAVSYVGMATKEVTVGNGKKLTVFLSANNEVLDEVMVVAFGTTKKEAFTGSAAVVKSEDLSKHIATNVQSTLAGSVPGLQIRGATGAPGSDGGSIKIRGIASLEASSDPLIIVDGAPYPASLSNIQQDDIESISVLKDAVSAALYGARGAAGVILITTKKGKTKDAQIKLDMKWGAMNRAVPDYDVITDPGEYYEAFYNQIHNYYYYGNGMSAADAWKTSNERLLGDLHYNVFTLPENELLIGMDGKLNPKATLGAKYVGSDGQTYWLQPDNWEDEAYKTALRQEYTLSVNGATDRSSYYASVGYLDETGILAHSGYKRLTARLKADYQARKWLKVGANVGYTNSDTEQNPSLGTSGNSTNTAFFVTSIAPIFPIYVRTIDESGNIAIKTNPITGNPEYDYGTVGAAYTGYPGLSRPFSSTGNPLGTNRFSKTNNKGQQLSATGTIDIDFTSFLKLNITSNVNWGHSNYSNYETMFEGPKQGVKGQLQKYQNDNVRTNHTQTLSYNDTFADKHNVSVLLGHEYYLAKTTYLNAVASGLFSEDILELNAAANHSYRSNSYTTKYNNEGFFGQMLYNYNERYYGQVTYRRDASSRFAKDNRWGNFWGIGASWVLSKESFMSDIHWIDYLKLRYSYGEQGNDNIGDFQFSDRYTLGTTMSPSFSGFGNKDITWETIGKHDLGLEFSVLGNRISGTVDYYYNKTRDLLFWLNIPESNGATGYYTNIGDIRNTGFELTLNGTAYRSRNIEVNISANISHNSTKILKLPESKTALHGGYTQSSIWYEVGGPLYNGFRKSYAGVNEQGEALYWCDASLVKENGSMETAEPGKNKDYTTTNPNLATYYQTGSLLPKFFGGFSANVKLWDFDLTATFDYQIGGKIYDSRYASFMEPRSSMNDAYGASNIHKDYIKSWSPTNTSSDVPRWQYMDQYTVAASDRFLTDASYLNFQSFMVGYNLPKKYATHLGIQGLRLYFSGENLGFWSARKGFDPRDSYTGNNSVASYSPVRTFTGGIQVSF